MMIGGFQLERGGLSSWLGKVWMGRCLDVHPPVPMRHVALRRKRDLQPA